MLEVRVGLVKLPQTPLGSLRSLQGRRAEMRRGNHRGHALVGQDTHGCNGLIEVGRAVVHGGQNVSVDVYHGFLNDRLRAVPERSPRSDRTLCRPCF